MGSCRRIASRTFLGGCRLGPREWGLAQLGIKMGGLGLRDPVPHSAGAYLASFRDAWEIAGKLDRDFDASDTMGGSQVAETARRANGWMGPEADFDFFSKPFKQKDTSALVDEELLRRLGADWQGELSFTAHLNLATEIGAGAFLMAPPVDDARKCSPQTFRMMLRRRLRIRVLQREQGCPHCDEIMDIYGDHAISCMGGPHRNRRHNRIRDALYKVKAMTGVKYHFKAEPGAKRSGVIAQDLEQICPEMVLQDKQGMKASLHRSKND